MVIVLFVLLEVGHVDWFKLSQEREQTNLNSVSFLYTVALISLIRAVKISGTQSLYEWKVYNKFSLFIPRIVFPWQMFAGPSPQNLLSTKKIINHFLTDLALPGRCRSWRREKLDDTFWLGLERLATEADDILNVENFLTWGA